MRIRVCRFFAAGLMGLTMNGMRAQAVEGPTNSGSRISINVVVTDEDGQPVRDLRQSDFAVFEDNARREMTAFSPSPKGWEGNYRITFSAARGEGGNEYHSVAVRVERPYLDVRTIKGYYAHR